LPTLARTVPAGPQWAHEIKHDGYRMICRRDGDRVRIFTRRGHDWTERMPVIAEALASLPITSVTIDGKAVICDRKGVSDFGILRASLSRRRGSRAAFMFAFDVLELNGTDLRPRPWSMRRELLIDLLGDSAGGVVLSEDVYGAHGPAIYEAARRMGLEGIVSKRIDRSYRSGRSRDWVKIKNPDAPAATRVIEP
jgi:ATP-dependent DNA ligase